MTNDERLELLRRVAEVAPKVMGVEFREGHTSEHTHTPLSVVFMGSYTCLGLANDIQDAAACFAMLDAMEKAGYDYCFEHIKGRRKSCLVEYGNDPVAMEWGDTVTEAIARAFVQVFGGD